MSMANRDKLQSCNFCSKSVREVRKLIAGPKVYICIECVELCVSIVSEETEAAQRVLAILSEGPKPTDTKALTWLKEMAADRPVEEITVSEFLNFVYGKLGRYALHVKHLTDRRELGLQVADLRRRQGEVTRTLGEKLHKLADLDELLKCSSEPAPAADHKTASVPEHDDPTY